MKKTYVLAAITVLLFLVTVPAFAQDGDGNGGGTNWVAITSGFAMAIASAGCGLAQSKAAAAAVEGMARNPGASDAIKFGLILALVFIETLALFSLAVIFVKVA